MSLLQLTWWSEFIEVMGAIITEVTGLVKFKLTELINLPSHILTNALFSLARHSYIYQYPIGYWYIFINKYKLI